MDATERSPVDEVLEADRVLRWKLRRLPGKMRRLANQVRLAGEMLRDYRKGVYREIPWRSILMLAGAVVYFLNPMDIIPDMITGIGFVDDAAVVGSVFASLRGDLLSYCLFKGYEPADYF